VGDEIPKPTLNVKISEYGAVVLPAVVPRARIVSTPMVAPKITDGVHAGCRRALPDDDTCANARSWRFQTAVTGVSAVETTAAATSWNDRVPPLGVQ
jgi:hypothetical protein